MKRKTSEQPVAVAASRPVDEAGAALQESASALDDMRADVERIDRALVALIAERVRVAQRIGAFKRRAGAPTLDPAREAAVVRRNAELAREHGLPAEEVREIFWRMIGLCRRAQVDTP